VVGDAAVAGVPPASGPAKVAMVPGTGPDDVAALPAPSGTTSAAATSHPLPTITPIALQPTSDSSPVRLRPPRPRCRRTRVTGWRPYPNGLAAGWSRSERSDVMTSTPRKATNAHVNGRSFETSAW